MATLSLTKRVLTDCSENNNAYETVLKLREAGLDISATDGGADIYVDDIDQIAEVDSILRTFRLRVRECAMVDNRDPNDRTPIDMRARVEDLARIGHPVARAIREKLLKLNLWD